MSKYPPIRTFGRAGGRALSNRQQCLIDDKLPQLSIPIGDRRNLDPKSLFNIDTREIWLEIGFGGGEHLTEQAKRNPDVGFLGCEPFIEGMAKCLSQTQDAGLQNIRLLMDDARPMLSSLAPCSIDRVFILFPDPWPKKRQQKRRLIQPEFLDDLATITIPGGSVRFATDVISYADEALGHFHKHPAFKWCAIHPDDWRCPPSDHIPTRYQQKRLGDCAPVWFDFELSSNMS